MTALFYSTMQQDLNDEKFARFYNINERPSASYFGVGQCQVGGDFYISDGVSWKTIGVDTSHNWGEQTAEEAGEGLYYFPDALFHLIISD